MSTQVKYSNKVFIVHYFPPLMTNVCKLLTIFVYSLLHASIKAEAFKFLLKLLLRVTVRIHAAAFSGLIYRGGHLLKSNHQVPEHFILCI